jgi:uncharacterized membrane protein
LSPLPVWVHELMVAPSAFALSFVHARRAVGARRAAGELLALAAYGYALEAVAIGLFGSHTYGAAWLAAPGGVPIAVALVWSALITSAMAVAARSGRPGAGARAAAAALVAVSLDLLLEPVAVRSGFWRWTPPGPWLGVPIGNFVGWAVIVAGYALGAERFAGERAPAREAAIRLLVAAGSILALVVVGLAWRMLGLERLFTGQRGWLAWAALLAAAAAVPRARAVAVQGDGLGARLGRAPGRGPVAVFLGVAAVFAADAALLRDARLGLVAMASLATLAWISGRASSGS